MIIIIITISRRITSHHNHQHLLRNPDTEVFCLDSSSWHRKGSNRDAPSVSSLRSITIIIITRSSSSIISIITSLIITKLTSSSSLALLISPGPGGNRAPDPPWPPALGGVPAQKRLIYQGNDPPPHTKAWFIKDCGVEPPLILLTKGKLSWFRPAFVIKIRNPKRHRQHRIQVHESSRKSARSWYYVFIRYVSWHFVSLLFIYIFHILAKRIIVFAMMQILLRTCTHTHTP